MDCICIYWNGCTYWNWTGGKYNIVKKINYLHKSDMFPPELWEYLVFVPTEVQIAVISRNWTSLVENVCIGPELVQNWTSKKAIFFKNKDGYSFHTKCDQDYLCILRENQLSLAGPNLDWVLVEYVHFGPELVQILHIPPDLMYMWHYCTHKKK